MKGAKLEVLVVNAQGIRQTNVVGRPAYYVIIQLGTQEHRSKVSKGKHHTVFWNEKMAFDFSLFQWTKLTHIKFRIMNKEIFSDGGFVGETIIHIGGIIAEGIDRGFLDVKPIPYNVVLEDSTYKGEIRIGFKVIANKELEMKTRGLSADENESKQPSGFNLWKLGSIKFLLYCFRRTSKVLLRRS